ncbi:dihydrofolate reductase family protein [Kineosporia babensis]|uniref:Dihydrofolate reductase family protein n=1 Tax=Kineosporia babensis TaxID=499548 RepID=A0A9X1NLJ5_9ACTN|nr:dihydrofolate reductase family protein [Kineosporia babensis]MCD5315754.1 dihydrofolate reductase family protein [Kineosporia babensis]
MRDVVLYQLLSLDGVAEEPGDWMHEVDDAVFENLRSVISDQDDILLGRGTYDYWVDYWPTSDVQPFADFVNTTPKHVFTSGAFEAAWDNTTVVTEPAVDYVRRLREQEGGDIGIHGSIRLAGSLINADLVDRLELVVAPAVAGSGRRLFGSGTAAHRLQLLKVSSSPTGAVFASYARPVPVPN